MRPALQEEKLQLLNEKSERPPLDEVHVNIVDRWTNHNDQKRWYGEHHGADGKFCRQNVGFFFGTQHAFVTHLVRINA